MSEKPQRGERAEGEAGPDLESRSASLISLLSDKVVGQMSALEVIIPSIQLHRSGLAPEGRPVGVFLLLGPTRTGKTRTVEALAEVLHRDAKKVVRIDCGEFQKEHEMGKLIGAPPGYVGHADSRPRFTQETLVEVMSPGCELALVLFDEIEKASSALVQLLLLRSPRVARSRKWLGSPRPDPFDDVARSLGCQARNRARSCRPCPCRGYARSRPPSPSRTTRSSVPTLEPLRRTAHRRTSASASRTNLRARSRTRSSRAGARHSRRRS